MTCRKGNWRLADLSSDDFLGCRGNHLPFRQLCAELGADVTMSEMAFARQLLKQNVVEKARLRIASNEPCYGEQLPVGQLLVNILHEDSIPYNRSAQCQHLLHP